MVEQNKNSHYLPGFVTEFIQRLVRKVRCRCRVRREVKQELIDHFSDALAECNGEQEKRNLAQDLIAEFGDAGLLAKLIRRAKKRCRPLWRKALFRTGQAAMGLYLLSCLGNAWRLDRGQYPQGLGELGRKGMPDYPYGTGALRYERRGEDFVLYSLAGDFDDDGGAANPKDRWGLEGGDGDRVFWPGH